MDPDMQQYLDVIEANTLDWVNRVRVMFGYDPVSRLADGVPGDEFIHPVTYSLPAACVLEGSRVLMLEQQVELAPPADVLAFIDSFDQALFPHLIDWDTALSLMLAAQGCPEDSAMLDELEQELFGDSAADWYDEA